MVKTVPTPWKLVILAKMVIVAKLAKSPIEWQIFKTDAKSDPFKLDN